MRQLFGLAARVAANYLAAAERNAVLKERAKARLSPAGKAAAHMLWQKRVAAGMPVMRRAMAQRRGVEA